MEARELLKNILAIDHQQPFGFDPISAERAKLIPTKDLAAYTGAPLHKVNSVIKPFTYKKRLLLLVLLIDIVAVIFIVNQILHSNLSVGVTFILLFGLTLLLLINGAVFLRSRKPTGLLKISSEGIFTTSYMVPWEQIADSFILKVSHGLISRSYLILLTREDFILRFDLFQFLMSANKLAVIIESFKLNSKDS